MLLPVKVVVPDKKVVNGPKIFGVVDKAIIVEEIKKVRVWHRKPHHHGIEGDMIRVIISEPRPGKEDKVYFEIVNESVESFCERVNKLMGSEWSKNILET